MFDWISHLFSTDAKDAGRNGLTLMLVTLLLISIIGVSYISQTRGVETAQYTELYVLGPNGQAGHYPTNLSAGEEGTIIVGVENHEKSQQAYTLIIRFDDKIIRSNEPSLEIGGTWEEPISLSSSTTGNHSLRIQLYMGKDAAISGPPYRELRLRIRVTES